MKPIQQWKINDITDFLKGVDKKTWVKAGLISGTLLLVFVLILWPAWFERPQVRSQIKTVKARVQSLEVLRQRKPEWARNKTDYARYIEQIKGRLYMSDEVSLLLGEISKLADRAGVSIIASKPQNADVKFPAPFDQRYDAKLYDFTVEGGYHALGAFVSKLESYPKLLRVETFHLTPREDTPKAHLADIQLLVVSMKRGASQ